VVVGCLIGVVGGGVIFGVGLGVGEGFFIFNF